MKRSQFSAMSHLDSFYRPALCPQRCLDFINQLEYPRKCDLKDNLVLLIDRGAVKEETRQPRRINSSTQCNTFAIIFRSTCQLLLLYSISLVNIYHQNSYPYHLRSASYIHSFTLSSTRIILASITNVNTTFYRFPPLHLSVRQ